MFSRENIPLINTMKLPKTYEPNQYEPEIYAMWEKSGAFEPTAKGEPYSVVMPPPNANGNLHIGHALMANLEDILVRYYRMQGRDAIYIPGADHAGFETWVVYEKELAKEGKSRFDFKREELYSQVWDFVEKHRGNMELQLRALGVSASWPNLVFTLDKKVIDTVYETFKKLWDDGLVYRGERIVNYSTKYQTSYADIEVDHRTQKGNLWSFAYPLSNGEGEIVVATTRPETYFGDTAVAVHPEDERYKGYIGKTVRLPLMDREIKIVANEHVDPEYGSGAVKVTPAHDPNDFEIGERHNLERIQVIDFDGNMINVPEAFMGLPAQDARDAAVKALDAAGFLRGEETIEHTVGYDYKSGLPIQPLIKEQWFIKVGPLVKRAKQAIENGDVVIYPKNKSDQLIRYYDNLRDWNISRQIPWGIPIPAFQNVNDPEDWIFDDRVEEEVIEVGDKTYRREEDTFDTWFSSGQWPFITTDYLSDGELSRFYPNNVLETGHDILYPWVSRMIMLGLYATDEVPFKEVYLHGLVLDEHSQKMSKSKGNVINPMDAITEYGSDALRLGLIASRSAGQNQAFSIGKVLAGRNFCNKLWNISRFIESKLDDNFRPSEPEVKTIADHWIVDQLTTSIKNIGDQIEDYRFAEAGDTVYHTIWDSVADWYIEASKSQDNNQLLAWVLDTSLRIAHPFAPFLTETIWQTLPWTQGTLTTTSWPETIEFDPIASAEFDRLRKLITETRFVTAELPGNQKYSLVYENDSLIQDNADLITHLARLKEVKQTDQPKGLRLAASGREAWLELSAETLYEHQSNLEKRLAETRNKLSDLQARLKNPAYKAKAPTKLVEETETQVTDSKALIERLERELEVI